MIMKIIRKWEENKHKLEEAIRKDTSLNTCEYIDLVKLVVTYILNGRNDDVYWHEDRWSTDYIMWIGSYSCQGALLFVIPKEIPGHGNQWKPRAITLDEYLITYQYYGSCSATDTLIAIQQSVWDSPDYDGNDDRVPTEEQVKDYMTLCRDLICHMTYIDEYDWSIR